MKVEGVVLNLKKLWWLKINSNSIRATFDESVFPYLIKVKYIINDTEYIKNKILILNEELRIGDKVIITCDVKTSKILNIESSKVTI